MVHLALRQIIHSTFELTPEDEEMFTQILHSMNDILNMVDGEDFIKLHKKFLDHLERIRERGATAQLWLLYYDLVTLVEQFIEAARCGIWELHLETIRKMLPFFHATGHFKYAESAYIYLQDMCKLKYGSQSAFIICRL